MKDYNLIKVKFKSFDDFVNSRIYIIRTYGSTPICRGKSLYVSDFVASILLSSFKSASL